MIIDVYFGDKKLPWYIDTELKSMSDANVRLTIKTPHRKNCLKIEDLRAGDYFTWEDNKDNPYFINLMISPTEFISVWKQGASFVMTHKISTYARSSVVKLNLKELVFEKEV